MLNCVWIFLLFGLISLVICCPIVPYDQHAIHRSRLYYMLVFALDHDEGDTPADMLYSSVA
jgi:hypothetical protein